MASLQDIHASAGIGEGTQIGSFCVIEQDVEIGTCCQIGHHVVIHKGSRIGDHVRIDAHSVIGKSPMRAARSIFQKAEDWSPAQIGSNCLVGAMVTIYEGSEIGAHCLVADSAAIRENVKIDEYTIIGRLVTVENYTHVGKKCKLETGFSLPERGAPGRELEGSGRSQDFDQEIIHPHFDPAPLFQPHPAVSGVVVIVIRNAVA